MTQRLLSINDGENFRDLGGYQTTDGRTVKWRKLIRSGALGRLSANDLTYLQQFNLTHDIDLRSPREVDSLPDRIPEGTHFHHEPVFGTDLTEASKRTSELEPVMNIKPNTGSKHMREVYRLMTELDSATKAYRNFFTYLLETPEDGAVIFHCQAGKDRTGIGAYLVLSALGVDQKTIEQDYLLTNQTTKQWIDDRLNELKDQGATQTFIDNYAQLAGVSLDYLNSAIQEINTNYGSTQRFLRDALQLSATDLKDLRTLYLDD